eukprot:gb/GECH01006954.1/.p1 GENE.gb/GECH01006954.1/~~gb/GECH01006954.1/.p1  ORF type:complete len:726 (+),score=111.92 gb/GECH01006954.1/:1-2178(+)
MKILFLVFLMLWWTTRTGNTSLPPEENTDDTLPCCVLHDTRPCNNSEVIDSVCIYDRSCCQERWDRYCVVIAYYLGLCPVRCGDGICQGNETCTTCEYDCGLCDVSSCPSTTNISDPLFPRQWYLNNTGSWIINNTNPSPSDAPHLNNSITKQFQEADLDMNIDTDFDMDLNMDIDIGQDDSNANTHRNDGPSYSETQQISTMDNTTSTSIPTHNEERPTPGEDANVAAAWDLGYSGDGVRIAMVDDGLQWRHPDLQCNFDRRDSFDYDSETTDPSPSVLDDHGTACAGIAAARSNNWCGVGVAYCSRVSGIRLLVGAFGDALAAHALGHALDRIHVYINSWGPRDDGRSAPPFPLSRDALAHGAGRGRHGRGAVYVWAAGNGRMEGDDSNYDVLASSIYTIAVAASDWHGRHSTYSEPGANILVNAPSSTHTEDGGRTSEIATTDMLSLFGLSPAGCTPRFGGTSAAAPVAAGVVALVLEANPALTWRDVQYLLILTAQQNDPHNSEWITNAAGLKFNINYGFGRVDAAAAVLAAEEWDPVASAVDPEVLHIDFGEQGKSIPYADSSLLAEFHVESHIELEHVVLEVSLRHSSRGHVAIHLQSPHGTVVPLTRGRVRDHSTHLVSWPFMAVGFWGETSSGIWQVEITDTRDGHADTGSDGVVNALELRIHGVPSSSPHPLAVAPNIWLGITFATGSMVIIVAVVAVIIETLRRRRKQRKAKEIE